MKIWHSLDELKESPYLLFIRANGFETVGVLTKIKHYLDSDWLVNRRIGLGFTFSGEKIEEFLDRKNKRTGELEDLVQIQTDMVLVTARNSNSPDDEENDNFQYFLNPHQANELKDELDQVEEYKRMNRALEKKLDEAIKLRDSYFNRLEMAESEANGLRERVGLFSEQLGQARSQAEFYKTQNKREQIKLLEVEGFLTQQLHGASELGEMKGKTSDEVILDRAKKEYDIRKEMDKLGHGGNGVTKDDISSLEKKIFSKIESTSNVVDSKPIVKQMDVSEEESVGG